MTGPDFVIRANDLTRYFGRLCAVDQLSLAVPRGSVFALLGRNGSGKSTFIRMLLGMLEPTRGSATILGEDCRNLSPTTRGRIGYIAEGHPLIPWMRVKELVEFQKSFYPNWDQSIFTDVIDHFDLQPNTKAANLSRGQRAGLSLGLVLATGPELLIMDDPSMGLDPVARRTLLEGMIHVTRDTNRTIFFSSHVLEDVDRVADHVAILDRSVLRVSCSMETFPSRVKRMVLAFPDVPPNLPSIPGLLQARTDGNELRLTLANYDAEAHRIVESLGAISVQDTPLPFDDAVIAYLDSRRTENHWSGTGQLAEVST